MVAEILQLPLVSRVGIDRRIPAKAIAGVDIGAQDLRGRDQLERQHVQGQVNCGVSPVLLLERESSVVEAW